MGLDGSDSSPTARPEISEYVANRIARREAKARGEMPPALLQYLRRPDTPSDELDAAGVCQRCRKHHPRLYAHRHLPTAKFCVKCLDALSAEWISQANRAGALDRRYRTVYGISLADYGRMFLDQNGRCAICDRDQRHVVNHLLVVDHDHHTGKVRGLLCANCNAAIGLFAESSAALAGAILYIERHKNP